jgi:hypothetical protein
LFGRVARALPLRPLHGRSCCRLPSSNLLFGLPVVMDTNNDSIKEGDKVRRQRAHGWARPDCLDCPGLPWTACGSQALAHKRASRQSCGHSLGGRCTAAALAAPLDAPASKGCCRKQHTPRPAVAPRSKRYLLPSGPLPSRPPPPSHPKVLLSYKGQDLAVLEVDSKWTPNKVRRLRV